MASAKINQTTNKNKCKCSCIVNGVKHNTVIMAGEGFVVRTSSTDYKVYCKDCYNKLSHKVVNNRQAIVLDNSNTTKKSIIDGFEHVFSMTISNKNIDCINLVKRGNWNVVASGKYTVKVVSPCQTNLNGITKMLSSMTKNFNLKDITKMEIITKNVYLKGKELKVKSTVRMAVEDAKTSRNEWDDKFWR